MAKNSNKLLVPGVDEAMHQMKLEIAKEFGFDNYDSIDKGDLPSRVNGSIGGAITKKLVEMGQKQLNQQ